MSFVIDTDVPLPKRRGKQPLVAPVEYPFALMRIGESWFVEGIRTAQIQVAVSEFQRIHPPFKFSTRVVEDDPKYHKPGIRVWRTA